VAAVLLALGVCGPKVSAKLGVIAERRSFEMRNRLTGGKSFPDKPCLIFSSAPLAFEKLKWSE
jgi:hypothetical protein